MKEKLLFLLLAFEQPAEPVIPVAMVFCRCAYIVSNAMFPLFAHHHLTYYCLLPYSSQTRIALCACVRALVRSLQASSLGIKVGDMLLWPNSGGLAAPYHEFASLAHNAEQRPLVVEVERLDEDGTNEACPFQFRAERDEKGSDVDKRRSAMETFKQEGGKTIEVVMSTSVFGSRKTRIFQTES